MTIAKKIAKNNSTVDTANKLPTGNITVNSGIEAWAIVGKHFPKGNLEFYRAGKGFNNEDTFCYTLDEIIYVHATCTPDNKRVECIEIVNTYEESESERNILTVYINHDAEVNTATDNTNAPEVDTANNTGNITGNSDNELTDREKFLKAKEEIKTTAGRYLGDGKFAQIWQRNNGFGWRNIAKKNAALILAGYGLTVEEYLAARKQWIDEEVARGAAQCAIYYQAQFLRDKIRRDRKASNEPMPALFPAEDADDDDELIDEPEIDKDATAGSLTRAVNGTRTLSRILPRRELDGGDKRIEPVQHLPQGNERTLEGGSRMKKIPIKFRGRRVDNGEYVYGVYVKSVPMSSFPGIVDDDDYIHDVDPDSIAQLVGYDVDGKEVYEGDTLIDILGNEYTAKTRIELTCDDKQSYTGKAYYAGSVDNLKLVSKPKEE